MFHGCVRLALLAAANGFLATTGSAVTALKLYDQTSSCTASAVPSLFAPTQPQFGSVAADDFEVPAGASWGITQVNAPGIYGVFEGRTQAVTVEILADSDGVPGAAVPGCGYIGLTDFDDSNGSLAIHLRSTCILSASATTKYWLAVQAVMGDADSGTSGFGVWYWKENSVQTGDLAQWENPQNGFGENCTTWGPRATCNADGMPDQCFLIAGVTDIIFQDGFGEP
jgi:hypothetical protein